MFIDFLILAAIAAATVLLVWSLFMIERFRTQRLMVEMQLRDSEARSRAVTESMSDGVITTAPDGMIVDVNNAALDIFGYERVDLIGRSVTELVPRRHRDFFFGMIDHFSSLEDNFSEEEREARGLRKDGAEIYLKVSFADIRVGGERLFVGISRNVTEKKRIADALRASESQMRQITNAVPAFIAYFDADEVFRFHNKAYEEYFELTAEQIDGHTARDIFGEEVYKVIKPRVREVLAGYPVTFERTQMSKLGSERHLAVQYFPRYDDDGEDERVVGFYSLVTDITELKRIDRMKSEFVSTVSHELRTPLTSIRGSLGLIAGGVAGPLPDAAHGLVEIAKNNCERLIRLINEILDSEKIESGKMTFELAVVEIVPLLAHVLAANEGFAAQHQVRLVLDAPPDVLHVCVDADRLNQVVTNLVSNAVKFSPSGAAVDVRARRSGNRVRVEVQDHGSGIPDEFRGRIFQKFSQADSTDARPKGGTGLGLSIAKSIIEHLDGVIGFTSAAGKGTTFYFELPEWHATEPDGVLQPSANMRRRILVCEDDQDIARLIRMMLDKAGFEADIARDAAQARALLSRNRYAAMTVDIKLPGEDGLSLIRTLRDETDTRELPVIVVSATADEGRVQIDNETLTVSDWLQKPIDENRLILGIREAARRSGSIMPRTT